MIETKDLTREVFDLAVKAMEQDAEWGLRHPFPRIWSPKEIRILKKIGFFKKNRGK